MITRFSLVLIFIGMTALSFSQPFSKKYIMVFHTSDPGNPDPRNHVTRLMESDDGAVWMPVQNFQPVNGSVPDVVIRGNSFYLYHAGSVRIYDNISGIWSPKLSVEIRDDQNRKVRCADPSAIVDDSGRIVIFFLNTTNIPQGLDPAACDPYPCTKDFDSAIELPGSDGTQFRLQNGHRVEIILENGVAADPDVFSDEKEFLMLVSRGQSTAVFRSPAFHGSYAPYLGLPGSILTNAGGVPCGLFDPVKSRYWIYVSANSAEGSVIRRATVNNFDAQILENRFSTVLSASSLGLPAGTSCGSPSVITNTLESRPQGKPIEWKPFFTLNPDEGVNFSVDTTAIVVGGGVPVINIANDSSIILTSAGGPKLQVFSVQNNGNAYMSLPDIQRGPDGGFVYLPDGRTRFLSEEFAPDRTPQRHKSRIVSWISNDGKNWVKEPGIRYQPGLEDDSISSVPSFIQVNDSIWRMYYVGDFYRTNGIRAAISTDWGLNWRPGSFGNILKKGDVDPHPVYLSNGNVRLYFRTGFGAPNEINMATSGIAFNDSPDGIHFDTTRTILAISDSAAPAMLTLDPVVIKFPNGDVVCYMGTMPRIAGSEQPKLVAARSRKTTGIDRNHPRRYDEIAFSLFPNPASVTTNASITLKKTDHVLVQIFDLLGKKILTVKDEVLTAGSHTFPLFFERPGIYVIHISTSVNTISRLIHIIR